MNQYPSVGSVGAERTATGETSLSGETGSYLAAGGNTAPVLPAAGAELPASDAGLPAAGAEIPEADARLPAAGAELLAACTGSEAADSGLTELAGS